MLLRELCNLFAVDSSLLNDPENKTYSNKQLAEQALFVNVIIPQVHHFLYELTLALRASGELAITIDVDASRDRSARRAKAPARALRRRALQGGATNA